MGLLDTLRVVFSSDEKPIDLPAPPPGAQTPDDPAEIPPDVGDADSGARP